MKAGVGKWRVWLPTLLMVICVVTFSRLAVWQYHRAHETEARIAAIEAARHAPPTRLVAAKMDKMPRYAHVLVKGHYEASRQVLLMEMTQPGGIRVGYEVLTPLKLPSGEVLLINRGWIPRQTDGTTKADLSVTNSSVAVTGFLAPLPQPGLHLGGNPATVNHWPARLLFPTWSELEQIYGADLLHHMVLLAPNEPYGFYRQWQMRPRHGPHQNYSYMVQWIAFAVVVFGLWLWFTIKRLRRRRKA